MVHLRGYGIMAPMVPEISPVDGKAQPFLAPYTNSEKAVAHQNARVGLRQREPPVHLQSAATRIHSVSFLKDGTVLIRLILPLPDGLVQFDVSLKLVQVLGRTSMIREGRVEPEERSQFPPQSKGQILRRDLWKEPLIRGHGPSDMTNSGVGTGMGASAAPLFIITESGTINGGRALHSHGG